MVLIKMINKHDEKLIALLRTNARSSISDLARGLDVSRSTVQSRLFKLEQSGVITGYSVEFGSAYIEGLVSAHVSIKVRQKLTTQTTIALSILIRSVHCMRLAASTT